MPNWAEGTLKIRGKQEDIINCLKEYMLGMTVHVFSRGEDGEPTVDYKEADIETKQDEFEFTAVCEKGFYIKGTIRAFVESKIIVFDIRGEEIEELEITDFKQAWSVVPDNYLEMSEKHNLDIKIFTFEKGMEFTQEIEIIKGKLTKDIAKKYDDYFWEVPFANLGG